MSTKLFVGNLSYQVTEQELRDAFSQSDRTVHSVRIAVDRETQRPRGFAFIEVATDEDADSAIRDWNGTALNGRNLFVEKAQERPPGAPRGPRPSRPPGAAPGPGGPRSFGGPGGGGPRPGGPGGPRSFGGPSRYPMASAIPDRDEGRRRSARPERKTEPKRRASNRPKEEGNERGGKWRWDGNDDY